MGLYRLHTLTSSKPCGLRVDMTAWDGKTFWAEYGNFSVGPESTNYRLVLRRYSWDSTLCNSMLYQNGMMFSTYDRDNDRDWEGSCAGTHRAGWWYYNCYHVNPAGVYLSGGVCDNTGIFWGNVDDYCYYYSWKRMTFTLIPQ